MSFRAGTTLYENLGVREDESQENIGKAYKKLAREWHPDKCASARKSSATAVFQALNHAHSILGDPFEREKYDRELKDERARALCNKKREEARLDAENKKRERAAEREAAKASDHGHKKSRGEVGVKVFTIYLGDEFSRSLMNNKTSIASWAKMDHIACLGTMAVSLTQLREIGLFALLADHFGFDLCGSCAETTNALLFAAPSTTKNVYTPQSLLHEDEYLIATIENGILQYLSTQLASSSDACFVVFRSRGANGASNGHTRDNPATTNSIMTSYQVVFGGVLHRGRWFVDNRTKGSAQSASDYGEVKTQNGRVTVGQLAELVANEARVRQKSLSLSTHLVQLVTGNLENLSTTKTVQNYRLCTEMPEESTFLEPAPLITIVAVFARSQEDTGVAKAGGSRTFYNNASPYGSKDDVIRGFAHQLLVEYRMGKVPACMRNYKPVDSSPHVLGRALQNFLRDVATDFTTITTAQ